MGKTSKVKKANKQRTKLLRQGKLKRKRNKKPPPPKPPKNPEPEYEDEEDSPDDSEDLLKMVDQEDLTFISESVRNSAYSFLNGCKRKQREPSPTEEIEEKYEEDQDTDQPKRTKFLLPVKTKEGIIRREMAEKLHSDDEDEEAPQENKDEGSAKEDDDDDVSDLIQSERKIPNKPVSMAEILLWREQTLAQSKLKIGLLCSSLLENPHEKVGNLSKLLDMFDAWSPETQVTLKKILIASLLEVFNDLLPSYQISHKNDEGVKLKKETRDLQSFENRLLKGYKMYLTKLEKLTGKLISKKGAKPATSTEVSIGILAIKSLCELVKNHSYFNFGKNIVQLLTPFLNNRLPDVRALVSEAFRHLFISDKKGQITLDAVRCINSFVKKRATVRTEVVTILIHLRLDSVNLDSAKDAENKQKKAQAKKSRLINLSKKERKRQKQLETVEKELLETKAEENRTSRMNNLTEVTKLVFTIYFRILKKGPTSGLLSASLRGVAKFAHNINVEFYEDLVLILKSLLAEEDLKLEEILNIALTVFTVLSSHGESFNIDPTHFYTQAYQAMLHINASTKDTLSFLLLDCLEKIVLGRRKKLTQQRLLAFLKRLGTIALSSQHHVALSMLGLIRQVLLINRSVELLVDVDSGSGQGLFQPELDDPEYSNASSAALFELHALQRHYHPVVRTFATNIGAGAPISGEHTIPLNLAKFTAKEMVSHFDPSQVAFRPSVPPPKQDVDDKARKPLQDPALTYVLDQVSNAPLGTDFRPLFNTEMSPIKTEKCDE